MFEEKSSFNIALRAYALRLWLSAQTPQLRFGSILSMVNLLFGASQTYVAHRAYSELCERCSKSSCLLLFSFWTGFQDLQDWRRIVSRPFDAACRVCTQAAKPQRKRGNGALRIEWEHQPTIRGVGSLEIREFC